MGLTKKDFKELATMCGNIDNELDRSKVIDFCLTFCERQNSMFDRGRFREWVRRVANDESTVGLG